VIALLTKKAAGVESGGGREKSSTSLSFDQVDPLLANLLTGHDQPVLLSQRAARAQHGPRGVLLPAHRSHNFLKGWFRPRA